MTMNNCNCGCESHSDCCGSYTQQPAYRQPRIKMVYCVMPTTQNSKSLVVHIKKIDSCTGDRIPGVPIEICDQYGRCAQAITNVAGIVSFSVECKMNYTIKELRTPRGYIPAKKSVKLKVDDKGVMTVDGALYQSMINGDPHFIEFQNDPIYAPHNDMICYVVAEQPVSMPGYIGSCGCEHHHRDNCSCSCHD